MKITFKAKMCWIKLEEAKQAKLLIKISCRSR